MIKTKNTLKGKLNVSIVKEYPELEEITVTPTLDGQELKPSKYGYSKVTINEIPATDVTIVPTVEEQTKTGIFKTVKVNAIEGQELNLNPSEEQQNFEGVFLGVNINPIQVEEITTDLDFSNSDAIELTAKQGAYLKKAVISKDANLTPENIKSGVTVNGISGNVADTSDADATSDDIAKGKTAYVNNEKVTGTMEATSDEELEASFISSIDDSLGANCTKLPSSTAKIGNYAFYNRSKLGLTELPDSVISIGNNAFQNCTILPLVKISSNLQTIGTYAFDACGELALTELPDSITSIGNYAFQNCKKLALIELPENVTWGTHVFYGCSKLAITELPAGFGTIQSNMFRNCTSLTEITCKGAVTNVNGASFSGCSNLSKFALPNITRVPNLQNSSAFNNTAIANGTGYIYVPDALVDSFKSASNWSTYADQIKGVSELV